MKKTLLAVAIATLSVFTINAQWQPVGTAGFTTGGVASPSLAFNSNDVPYLAFKDGASAQKATVMKFDGTDWVTVGTAGLSSHFAYSPTIAINSNDVPYVAYRDDINSSGNKLTVKKFDGTNWVIVGAAEFSGNVSDKISFAFNSNDVPYVAFICSDVINYAVNQVTVMKFDGTNWVVVGTEGFSFAEDLSLAFDSNDVPHLAYKDGNNSNKATVMKFDGTDWVPVGTAGFTPENVGYTSLAFNSSDEPYVAFRDDANSDKVSVAKFDGTNWVTVGSAGFSAGIASYTSLAFNSNDEPHVAFREFVSGSIQNQATVMKFDGTNWVMVGNQGFSAGYADETSLVFNSNDEPYVSYVDVPKLYKATVMKLGDGTPGTPGTTGITDLGTLNNSILVYPNPTNSIINFSVQSNVQLTNMTGQVIASKTNVNTLDLSDHPTGIYFITLTDKKGQIVQRSKIVKE